MKMTIEEADNRLSELGKLYPVRGENFYPLTESEIQNLEKTIGERLTEPYRSLLAKYGNWSFSEFVSYPCSNLTMMEIIRGKPINLSENNWLSYMYGGAEDDTYSLQRAIKTYKERMPETLIPIGDDGGGNKICLGVSGEEKGKVFYWDHNNEWDEEDYFEEEGEPMPPEMKFQNVYLVANSFEEFINQLKIEDI